MKIIKEFKEFAVKGNVIDLAVGVIIGGAFGTIVSSLVNDIIMPPISYLTKGIDFKNLKLVLTNAANGQPSATLNYGNFIQNVVQFLIIAFVIFLMVKAINTLKRKKQEQPVPPSAPKEEIALLTEIRDVLKKR